jgi:hypothetical protein
VVKGHAERNAVNAPIQGPSQYERAGIYIPGRI